MDGSDGRSRRAVLATAGGALAAAAAVPTVREAPRTRRQTGAATIQHPATSEPGDRADFLWLTSGRWRDAALREQLLAFARRRDLGLVLGQPPTNAPGVGETVRPALADAAEAGVETWVNVGAFQSTTAATFLSDDAVRERHLAGLREVARELDRHDAGGRVICWQEAPVMGQWAAGGEWTRASVDALLAHGPAVFAAQKSALLDANPDLDVGAFVHFPYVVDSKQPDVFAELADGMRARGTTPDFGFADFYRGWYEKDAGPDAADAAVRSLVGNAREHLGTDVYYLGQAHTISPGHTPSRQAVRSNLRAALGAGAAGVGWYVASSYRPTTRGFDPFVPNAEGAAFEEGPVCTATVALDRYRDAWAATLATRADEAPDDRVDLWLHGDEFAYGRHRVAARTAAGDWQFLGHVGGYLDGDYPYARPRTAIMGALDRERFVDGGGLDLRVETAENATPTSLETVIAVPWDPATPTTERRATDLIEGPAPVADHELGRADAGERLAPGETVRLTVPVGDGTASLTPLVYPNHEATIERLAAADATPQVDPADRFDLWLAGDGLANGAEPVGLLDRFGEPVDPGAAAVATASGERVALYYGLERDRFLGDGLAFADDGVDPALGAAYAMPYAGSACFRPPERAADLLDEQPEAAATFAADRVAFE